MSLWRQNVVDIAAAIAAAIAAGAAWYAAWETRRAATSQLLSGLISEYHTPDMQTALQQMGNLWNNNGHGQITEATIKKLKANDREFDRARRMVHWYYKKIWMLHQTRGISKLQVRHLVSNTNGYELWKSFVLPLSKKVHKSDDPEWFAWVEPFCEIVEGG